jgi:hypothetical protein
MNLHWIACGPVLDTAHHGYGCGYPQTAHPGLARAAMPTPAIVRLVSRSKLDRRGSNLLKPSSLHGRSASRFPNRRREQFPPPKRKPSRSKAVSAKVNARSGAIHATSPGRLWLHCLCGAGWNGRIQGQARLRVRSPWKSRLAGRQHRCRRNREADRRTPRTAARDARTVRFYLLVHC